MLTRPLRRASLVIVFGAAALAASACDKMPLVAPTGTVITLFANNTVLPIDGSIEITAVAIEAGSAPSTGTGTGTGTGTSTSAGATAAQGTPVHNGTVLTFTTTLGRIEPQEARTHNGQATVRLFAGGASGVATVRAFSGGAASNELKLNVGAAAAKTVFVSSTPQTLSSAGGTAQISARVVDVNGTSLPGVPVTFTADNGTLSTSTAVTDANGVAITSLTTTRETKVTATVSGEVKAEFTVRVNTAFTLALTSSTSAPVQNQPVTFTVTPGGGTGTNVIRNVVVNFDDGDVANLGTITGTTTVSHVFARSGTYQVRAQGTDVNGEIVSAAAVVSVTEQLPLAVNLSAAPSTARRGVDTVNFTATVSGGSPIRYEWDFGDGTTAVTTGPTTAHFYPGTTPTGPVRVRVTVRANNAADGLAETTVIITTP